MALSRWMAYPGGPHRANLNTATRGRIRNGDKPKLSPTFAARTPTQDEHAAHDVKVLDGRDVGGDADPIPGMAIARGQSRCASPPATAQPAHRHPCPAASAG